jgi:thiol-disulfide isomerase/thioredoxin
MNKVIYTIYALLLGLMLSFIFSMNAYAYKVGDKIDADVAKLLKIEDYQGISVVDFFASWCVSCIIELPLINKLSKQLDDKQARIIGIGMDEDLAEGLAFQKELGLEFFVYNDYKQEVVAKFDPIGVPAIYYIKDGVVKKVIYGAVEHIDQVIKADIDKLE